MLNSTLASLSLSKLSNFISANQCDLKFNTPTPSSHLLMNHSSSSSDCTAADCVSNVIRRLLCNNLRHTVPDNVEAEDTIRPNATAIEHGNSQSPGLVARLMGLESMPITPPPRFMGKSRSTNSIDSWSGFLADRRRTGVSATRSFRETPMHSREESKEFMFPSLALDGGNGEFSSNRVEFNVGRGGSRETKVKAGTGQSKKESKTESRGEEKRIRMLVRCKGDSSKRNYSNAETRNKLAIANRRTELECNSQNLSPVSVLDNPMGTDNEYRNSRDSTIVGDDRNKMPRNPRRSKLTSDPAKRNNPSPRIQLLESCRNGRIPSADDSNKKSRKPDQVSQIRGFIIQLAGEDVKMSNWASSQKYEYGEEIAALIGAWISDSLVCEAIIELSGLAFGS